MFNDIGTATHERFERVVGKEDAYRLRKKYGYNSRQYGQMVSLVVECAFNKHDAEEQVDELIGKYTIADLIKDMHRLDYDYRVTTEIAITCKELIEKYVPRALDVGEE